GQAARSSREQGGRRQKRSAVGSPAEQTDRTPEACREGSASPQFGHGDDVAGPVADGQENDRGSVAGRPLEQLLAVFHFPGVIGNARRTGAFGAISRGQVSAVGAEGDGGYGGIQLDCCRRRGARPLSLTGRILVVQLEHSLPVSPFVPHRLSLA